MCLLGFCFCLCFLGFVRLKTVSFNTSNELSVRKKHKCCAYVQDKIELRVYAYVQEGYDQARPFYNAKKHLLRAV